MSLLVDYGKVLFSSANELQQNSNASATKMDCIVVDLSRLYLTHVTVCLMSIVRKQ